MAKKNWATVKDVAEWFNKLVAEGKGDYVADVDDNCGGVYSLEKFERYGYVDDKNGSIIIGDFYEHNES